MEEPPSDSRDSSDEPSTAKTPTGTPVGVDDPYEHVDRCDHCTDDGRCRFAFERFEADPAFARERRDDDYRCPVATARADGHADGADEWDEWADCPNFAATTDGKQCRRCGLEERRVAHADERALIEEHHLSYADGRASVGGEGAGGAGEAADESVAPADLDLGVGFEGLGSPSVDARGDEGTENDADRSDDAAGETPAHEITVALCRWCHAKVHKSWARIDDDVSPDPEAIATREQRRGEELREATFSTAAERFDRDGSR